MSSISSSLTRLLALSMTALLFPLSVIASDPPDDESQELEEVVTTGMRVSQGGALGTVASGRR